VFDRFPPAPGEILGAVVTCYGKVMVSEDGAGTVLLHKVDARRRIRPVSHDVTETIDRIDLVFLDRGQSTVQGMKIRVNVRYKSNLHTFCCDFPLHLGRQRGGFTSGELILTRGSYDS
jgi:hypothetical protein